MARAGDCQPRSSRRIRGATLSIRVTPQEKAAFGTAAKRHGYRGASGWVRELMQAECGSLPRSTRMASGCLGQAAARLQNWSQTPGLPGDLAQALQDIAAGMHELQKGLLAISTIGDEDGL